MKNNYIMETKVEQLIDQDLMDYVNKCSQHLFITEVSKRFFHTRFVDTKFGKRIMVLEFDGVKTPYIKLLNPERQWKESFKRNQFPLHMEDKKTSIKFFKAMKEKIADIEKVVYDNFNGKDEWYYRKGDKIFDLIAKELEGMTPVFEKKD